MKNILVSVFLFAAIPITPYKKPGPLSHPLPVAHNLFIITTDGFRWQELFNGADSLLINDDAYTPDATTVKALYWAASPEERRKKLMPFFWNVINSKGQLFGNRIYDNKVNNANQYLKSYPGYNEIFTGNTDDNISSNGKNPNPNLNILEYLDRQVNFRGKVAAFTSWDVFPYILNAGRNLLFINSGYEKPIDPPSSAQQMINRVEDDGIENKTSTRYDELTFLNAKEYISNHRPRVVYLGFGETDEFAHQGRYDLYLDQANKIDKMIAELWHWVQTTPGYANNTTFIITTDHGRGNRKNKWVSHGELIRGSSQTWLAIMGPSIPGLGEVKTAEQIYQKQIAQTIANMVGENFESNEEVAPAITLR